MQFSAIIIAYQTRQPLILLSDNLNSVKYLKNIEAVYGYSSGIDNASKMMDRSLRYCEVLTVLL